METPRSILRALREGQWLTSLDLKDEYFHIKIHPGSRDYLSFCHEGTVAVQSSAIQFINQPTGIHKSLHAGSRFHPFTRSKALHVSGRLVDKHKLSPGSTIILAQVPVPRLGWVLNLNRSDLIPSQQTTDLGIWLDSSTGIAKPSVTRETKWLSISGDFLVRRQKSA